MNLCAVYRVELPDGDALCAHHAGDDDDGWAENNPCMCDLLHRGRIPPRLLPAEREDEFCADVEVA